jgi:signal transduction histidine kinase
MADGLAVVDAGGMVAWWNPAAAALTGIAAADALGSAVPFPYQLRVDGGEHQLANGRWVEVLCSALPGEDPTETVVTFRDISAAKMVEETKNLFLATTGHELRTPLTVIRGFADTLSARWDELTEEERREGIRIIAVRAEGLAALVEQVLLSSQVEVGARRLQRQVIDVEPVLAAAAIDVRSLSDRHLVTVVVPAGLPQLLADEHSVRTVLGHLVDNAVKYSPEGGRIVLSAHLSADQTMICLVVDDEGIGVASEDQERVFDRFFQADGGDTRRRGGFGLGLYIVRRLVQAHDGRVVMSRRPDGQPGSRVEVCLPVGGSSEVRLSNRR